MKNIIFFFSFLEGLFKEDSEDIKSPITPSEDQSNSYFQDEENKEKSESKRTTKSKCFEEIYEIDDKIIGQVEFSLYFF